MASRGEHLVRADRRFVTGGGGFARAVAPLFARVLDQLDQRLERGGFEATLPDGTGRRIGFHAPGPVAVVRLHSWMSLVHLTSSGSVGWYKAWAAGEWSSPDPVLLFELFSANAISLGDVARAKGPMRLLNALSHRLRDNGLAQARDNIAAHYDLGNDFYAAWLDRTMSYSSARFSSPLSLAGGTGGGHVANASGRLSPNPSRESEGELESAQHRKISLLLDRLEIHPRTRLLEIGCGWGSLAIEAARRGATVTALTLSAEQKGWADAKIAEAGLSDRIEIRLQDYRLVTEAYDAIASVEMVEAVGERWWPAYLDMVAQSLAPGGRAALQFISIDHRLFDPYSASADFIQAYIFPGGMLLDEPRFETLAKARGLSWHDRDGFGLDYAETLRQWRVRYDTAVRAGWLNEFSAEFHDLWRYYLMYCEGGFRGRGIDVAQVTLVKN